MGACSAYGCTNRSTDTQPGITYHRFPRDEIKKRAWIKAVRRRDWVPSKYAVLCSTHFREEDINRAGSNIRLHKHAIPCIFPAFPPHLQKVRRSKQTMSEKTAMLILAEGAEEMEAVISIDVLRRAGIKVTVAGLEGAGTVACSRDVKIVPDASLDDAMKRGSYDAVILPGGLKGAESLAKDVRVKQLLRDQEASGRLIAAICAAPIALKSHKIGLNKSLTSYPSKRAEMKEGGQYNYKEDRVVVDGDLITSRGPGTAFEFALAIVEKLLGKDVANSLIHPMLIKM